MSQYDPRYAKEITFSPDLPNAKIPPELRNLRFSIVWLDNQKAAQLLALDSENNVRPLNKTTVNKYLREMSEDTWHDISGASLVTVPADGVHGRATKRQRLTDGRHRVTAAAELPDDFGHYTPLWTNLHPEAEKFHDIGDRRPFSVKLRTAGEKNPLQLAAIVKWATAYEVLSFRHNIGGASPTDSEMEAYFFGDADNAELLRWCTACLADVKSELEMLPAVFGALLYLTSVFTDPDTARAFWVTHLGERIQLTHEHPAYQLNKRLGVINKATKGHAYNPHWAHGINAWNMWINNQKGPWGKLPMTPRSGWHSGNIPLLEPHHWRDKYPFVNDDEYFDEEQEDGLE